MSMWIDGQEVAPVVVVDTGSAELEEAYIEVIGEANNDE